MWGSPTDLRFATSKRMPASYAVRNPIATHSKSPHEMPPLRRDVHPKINGQNAAISTSKTFRTNIWVWPV